VVADLQVQRMVEQYSLEAILAVGCRVSSPHGTAICFDLSPCPRFRYPQDFDGGIVADIEDALRFIEHNTRTAYRIETTIPVKPRSSKQRYRLTHAGIEYLRKIQEHK
jgi:hypothetical protein